MRSRYGAEIRSSAWAMLSRSANLKLNHAEAVGYRRSELRGEGEAGDRNMAATTQDLQERRWKQRREHSRVETGTFQHVQEKKKPAKETKQEQPVGE